MYNGLLIFQNIRSLGDADAYVVVYSITELGSFQRAIEILNDIQAKTDRMPAIIFVANKSDLVRSRQVSDEGTYPRLPDSNSRGISGV